MILYDWEKEEDECDHPDADILWDLRDRTLKCARCGKEVKGWNK